VAVSVFDQIGKLLALLEEANLEALQPLVASGLVSSYFAREDLLKQRTVTAIEAVTGGHVQHIYHAQLTNAQALELDGTTDPGDLVSDLLDLLEAANEAIIAALEDNCWVGNLYRFLRKPPAAPLSEALAPGLPGATRPGDPSLVPCDNIPNANPPCRLLTTNQCQIVGGQPGTPGTACPVS
jgi:hypothetical protein